MCDLESSHEFMAVAGCFISASSFFVFNGEWGPRLRCITVTSCDDVGTGRWRLLWGLSDVIIKVFNRQN